MLNPATGQLNFQDGDILITPDLSREQFLAEPWGDAAKHWVTNEPWHSWKLAADVQSNGIELIVILYFHGEKLTMVHLCDSHDKYGTSWDDHSMEKEMLRKQSHDDWLDACIGNERKFEWGDVFSEYDQQSGSSGIVIRFAE